MTATEKLERRIARFSRRCAKIVLELRELGDVDGARRLEAVAIGIAAEMRREARP